MSDIDSRARRLSIPKDWDEVVSVIKNKYEKEERPKLCPKCKETKTVFIGAVCKDCKNKNIDFYY